MRKLLRFIGLDKWDSLVWKHRIEGMVYLIVLTTAVYAVVTMVGCVPMERASTLEQKQRENVSQKATSEFASSVQPTPLRVHLKDGTIIEQPVAAKVFGKAESKESSDSSASGNSEWIESIPLFVKLIGLAVGIAALCGAGWLVLRSSKAADAAWKWTDEAISNKVNTLKALAAASTDPAKVQAYQEAIAQAEGLRAEVNK